MRTKICSTCKTEKDVQNFHKNKSCKDGYAYRCKQCASEQYYEKYRDKVLERSKSYNAQHREEKAAYDKKRREVLGEKLREYDRIRNRLPHRLAKSEEWIKKNPDKVSIIKQRYNTKNYKRLYEKYQHKYAECARKYRNRKQRARYSDELSQLVFSEAYNLARLRERTLGGCWEVDHIVPLHAKTASGLHNAFNLQVTTRDYNRRKRNRLEEPLVFGVFFNEL